jgi:hypothetical protein
MKALPPKANNRLLIQTGRFFDCPYEWAITDFVYWKSNTQDDRQWTCRMKPIQQYTPVKRIETITNVLDRLCERGLGFSKIPFGKPQRRRCGDGLTAEPVQSYQYIFDAKRFDEWLKSQPTKPPIRKRIDPYPKADSQLSGNGQDTYPKTDTTIMNKEENKKNDKEEVISFGEQPPKSAAVAPEHPVNLADEFEKMLQEMDGHRSKASSDDKAAEGGVSFGIPSMSVAPSSPSTIIQGASSKSNDGGQSKIGQETFSTRAPIVQPSVAGTTNTGAAGITAGHPGTSAQRAEGTIAKSGGVRGDIPKAVLEHAGWKLRQAKKSSPYTNESFDIIEQELLKRLADYNWNIYPTSGFPIPIQEVNILLPKLISEFGKHK